MSISYRTSATPASTSAAATSTTITIPSTVQAGDILVLGFCALSESSGSSTLSVTSTESAWTQYGSTAYVSTSDYETNSSLWYLEAAAADASATVTLHSTASLYLRGVMSAYPGAALPFDAVTSANTTTASDDLTCASVDTVAANDWGILICCGNTGPGGSSSLTAPSGYTLRTSIDGITGIADSNAAESAGASIGGGHFTMTATGCGTVWTIGLAPAGGGTPAPSPLVVPSLAAIQAACW